MRIWPGALMGLCLGLLLAGCQEDSDVPDVSDPPDNHEPSSFGNPERVVIQDYQGHAMEPFLSRDGQYLFFNNLNSPDVITNIHYATRIADLEFAYQGEVAGINTDELEGVASLDAQGNLYFVSTRSYFDDLKTVYRAGFADGIATDTETVTGIVASDLGHLNFDVEINPQGDKIYTVDGIYSGNPYPDESNFLVYVAQGGGFVIHPDSDGIMANINSPDPEYAACISADGLEFFFTRLEDPAIPEFSTYQATRSSLTDPFGPPRRIEAITGFAEAPTLSPDEKALYYHMKVDDVFVIYRVTRL